MLNNDITNWKSSIAQKSRFIQVGPNGLVPLYALYPSFFGQSFGEEYFNAYNEYVSKTRLENEVFKYTFTKSNQIKRGCASCSFKDDFTIPFDTKVIRELGFRKIKISGSLGIKEVDDGYQLIKIKNKTSTLHTMQFEHVPGKRDKNYQRYNFFWFDSITRQTYPYFITDSTNFDNSLLRIGYNASGSGFNDWYNRNVVVKIDFVK